MTLLGGGVRSAQARAAKPTVPLVMLLTRGGAQRLLRSAWPVYHRIEALPPSDPLAISVLRLYLALGGR